MFSIRVHLPGVEGHTMYECVSYKVRTRPAGATIEMEKRDGTSHTIDIPTGGKAYVMGDSGKTVDRVPWEPRTATLRGGR